MLASLPDFLATHWLYLLIAAVVCAVFSYKSEKFTAYLKKGLILFAILFCLAAAYELLTGKDLFSLPGSIESKLSDDQGKVETGRRYYKSYEERFGEPPPKE